ncbi:MAG: nuclear transport factor 2 family protein [Pyrinomonadaceae bacterium]
MQPNIEVVRGLYDSFSKGDVPGVLNQMHEQVEWNEAENFIYADGNPYVGPQAVLEGVFMRIGTDWNDFKVTPEEWLDAGNRIVVLGTYRGQHRNTGSEVAAQFAHVWSLKEGRIVRFQQYTDTKQFADAVS